LDYFLKNIFKIRTQTFNRDYQLGFVDSDKIMDEIQEMIFKENEKLNDFKGAKFKAVFNKIHIDHYPDFISNLYGQRDKWSCTFKAVKEYSKFNMDITFNIILFLLIQQLQKAFDEISVGDIEEAGNNGVSVSKNEAVHIFSKFIINMLDDFHGKERMFDISDVELEKMNNIKREELRIKAIKLEDEMRGMPIEYYYLKKGSSSFVDEIEGAEDVATSKEEIEKKHNEMREGIMSEGMGVLRDKLGRDPTAAELDEFTDQYLESERIDTEETLDQFNLVQPKEGLNVIESGGDYGDLPQGIEDAGDGMPADYFAENDVGNEFTPLVY
jgi:hypothetical protein